MLAEALILLTLIPSLLPGGLLGSRLEDAVRTDFFTFFRLKATGAVLALEKTYIAGFKPEGPQFRELVSVAVTLDASDQIVGIELSLARSFVNQEINGIFARDIAKSLLRSAVPPEDEKAIVDLANEIEFPEPDSHRTIAARPHAKLPAKPTLGYLTYLGKRSSFEQILTRCRLRMENRKVNKVDSLLVSVTTK